VSLHRKLLQIIFSAVLAVNALGAFADEGHIGQFLSIDQVLLLSLTTHPLIQSAESQFEAAKSELNASRWSRFPTIATGAQQSSDNIKTDTTTVNIPLWVGGRINAEIDMAKARKDSALFGVSEAKQTVMLEAVAKFFEYFKSEKKLVISRDNVSEHQRLYEIIERRVAAKTSADVDAMLALARLQYAKSANIQSKGINKIAKASLELLIEKPFNSVYFRKKPEALKINVDEAVHLGVSVSPKLSRIESEIKGLDASIKLARSVLYPQISLGYEHTKTHGAILNDDVGEQAFVSVQFQPGTGFSAASSVKAAKLRKMSALDSLEAEKRELRRQIRSAWNEYSSVSIQLEPSKVLVDATDSVVESYFRQYAVGKKSWLDVLNAQREATQAKNTLVDFEVLYLTSLYRLKILLNELNPNFLGV
jgi:adhesin transport system outer membrane protein